jgi:hypothetical protein
VNALTHLLDWGPVNVANAADQFKHLLLCRWSEPCRGLAIVTADRMRLLCGVSCFSFFPPTAQTNGRGKAVLHRMLVGVCRLPRNANARFATPLCCHTRRANTAVLSQGHPSQHYPCLHPVYHRILGTLSDPWSVRAAELFVAFWRRYGARRKNSPFLHCYVGSGELTDNAWWQSDCCARKGMHRAIDAQAVWFVRYTTGISCKAHPYENAGRQVTRPGGEVRADSPITG